MPFTAEGGREGGREDVGRGERKWEGGMSNHMGGGGGGGGRGEGEEGEWEGTRTTRTFIDVSVGILKALGNILPHFLRLERSFSTCR